MSLTDRTLILPDGRRLGYAEYGLPHGKPIIFMHGTPGSRLFHLPQWSNPSLELRIIVPDRPGMGLSDRQPGRRLTDWPNDVLRLSESLQLDSFSVAGISGGGPHALACAAALADRVDVAVVISGAAPLDTTDATVGMRRMNRTVVTLARRAPWVLRLMMAPNMFAARRFPDVYERVATKGLPEPDRVALRETALKEALLADNREAARRGARGVVEDLVIFTGSWGFDLSEIKMPVHLWHGDLDANAPIAMGERMASEISESVLHRCPGEGHMLAAKHWSEIEGVLKAGA